MQASCPQCAQAIIIPDAKVPDRPFTVKCPKCQAAVRLAGRGAAPAAAPPPEAPAPPPALVTTSGVGVTDMEQLFSTMCESKASDLHISVGSPPMLRHDGEIKPLPGRAPLTRDDTERMLWPIAPERNREEFKRRHDTDFAYEIPGLARFRCNFFMDRKGMGGVFRVIPSKIITAEEMGLSREILQLCHLPKGLVLVTGPTGSGKSTTLCALVDYINRNRTDHIITIEDPLEFVHENKRCLINQRQVGEHTDSFKDALRAALARGPRHRAGGGDARPRDRRDRDRDGRDRPPGLRHAAHVVGALHRRPHHRSVPGRSAGSDPRDAGREPQGRDQPDALQEDRRRASARSSRSSSAIPSVSNLIREAKIFQIPSIMQTGKKYGMCLMNESFADLVKRKVVEPQEAYAKALDKAGPPVHVQEERHRHVLGACGGPQSRRPP